jgi:ankyrin repeat protein
MLSRVGEIVRLFCDLGADTEARDNDRVRPLHYAAGYGDISVVKELIEVRNAEINARDDSGWTALSHARLNNHADISAYLVSQGGIV